MALLFGRYRLRSVRRQIQAEPKARISNPVSGGQCHLIHLTILKRFSWPSLAYMYRRRLQFNTFSAKEFLYTSCRPELFSIWNHYKYPSYPFHFIWIPMSWVYGYYKYFIVLVRGSTLDFRFILTSMVGSRTERGKKNTFTDYKTLPQSNFVMCFIWLGKRSGALG